MGPRDDSHRIQVLSLSPWGEGGFEAGQRYFAYCLAQHQSLPYQLACCELTDAR